MHVQVIREAPTPPPVTKVIIEFSDLEAQRLEAFLDGTYESMGRGPMETQRYGLSRAEIGLLVNLIGTAYKAAGR